MAPAEGSCFLPPAGPPSVPEDGRVGHMTGTFQVTKTMPGTLDKTARSARL